jgi:hypothetical protein
METRADLTAVTGEITRISKEIDSLQNKILSSQDVIAGLNAMPKMLAGAASLLHARGRSPVQISARQQSPAAQRSL